MADKVIDASAFAAALFNEPEAKAVAAATDGAQLFAPVLLEYELANVCTTKMRRYPEQRAALEEMFRTRTETPMRLVDVEYDEVVALADKLRLSAYDASYLWLARHLGLDLVTLDKKLAAAAKA